MAWPDWWDYEIVLSPQVVERMQDRYFSETDLRVMLDDAVDYSPSLVPDRYIVATRHEGDQWEVIVEPDELERILIVVTGYRVK